MSVSYVFHPLESQLREKIAGGTDLDPLAAVYVGDNIVVEFDQELTNEEKQTLNEFMADRYFKFQEDTKDPVANRNSLLLIAPNGVTWQLTVDDLGVVTTVVVKKP